MIGIVITGLAIATIVQSAKLFHKALSDRTWIDKQTKKEKK